MEPGRIDADDRGAPQVAPCRLLRGALHQPLARRSCPRLIAQQGAAPDSGDRGSAPARQISITASLGEPHQIAGRVHPHQDRRARRRSASPGSCIAPAQGQRRVSVCASRSLRPSRTAISPAGAPATARAYCCTSTRLRRMPAALGQIPRPPPGIWCGSETRPDSGSPAADPLSPGAASPSRLGDLLHPAAAGCPQAGRHFSMNS